MKPSNYTPQSVVWPRPICPRAERLVPWKPLPMNLSTCLETPITKDFVVYRHKTSKGRVLENAGTRTYKRPLGPGRWNNRPGVDWVAADKSQAYCPRAEGIVPWMFPTQVVYLLMNFSLVTRFPRLDDFARRYHVAVVASKEVDQ